MAATLNNPLKESLGRYCDYLVKAGVKCFQGALGGIEAATGYIRPLVAGDALAGVFVDEFDNTSGADGAITAKVLKGNEGSFCKQVNVDSLVITSIGEAVYASDDNSLSMVNGGSDTEVGKVENYISDGVGIVRFATL